MKFPWSEAELICLLNYLLKIIEINYSKKISHCNLRPEFVQIKYNK